MKESKELTQQNGSCRLILASKSPRRVEFMRGLGVAFECIPSHVDETTTLTDPAEVAEALALCKAQAVAEMLKQGAGSSGVSERDADSGGNGKRTLILGADTIVVLHNQILGKPTTREHAYQMLMRMSGRRHQVFTGVALIDAHTGTVACRHEVSDVFFRSLDPAEVRWYAKTEEPMDKAGAYALQGAASAFVEKIVGCYSNVIGLPMPLTVRMLRTAGLQVLGFTE